MTEALCERMCQCGFLPFNLTKIERPEPQYGGREGTLVVSEVDKRHGKEGKTLSGRFNGYLGSWRLIKLLYLVLLIPMAVQQIINVVATYQYGNRDKA